MLLRYCWQIANCTYLTCAISCVFNHETIITISMMNRFLAYPPYPSLGNHNTRSAITLDEFSLSRIFGKWNNKIRIHFWFGLNHSAYKFQDSFNLLCINSSLLCMAEWYYIVWIYYRLSLHHSWWALYLFVF